MRTAGQGAALVARIALADWATARLTGALHLPFFFDSWATSGGVLVGGLGAGVAGGILYNLIMAATTWGSGAWVWAASSVLVAWSTWIFHRANWVDIERPFHLMGAGALTGLANALLATAIRHFARGVPDDANTRAFREVLHALLGDVPAKLLTQEIVIECADKVICLITAASLVVLLFERSGRPPSAASSR